MSESLLSGIHIAVTRPKDQAKNLSKLIENANGHVIAFPLISITPLQDFQAFNTTIATLNEYDWAIFISTNAVQNGMPRLIQQNGVPEKLQFAAIGPTTASALNSFGINQVLTPQNRFDSESLLSLSEMRKINHKKVMIFRGVGGREVLADTLSARGAKISFAECYQRINPQTDCDLLTQFWTEKKLHGVIVTSSEAMRNLLDLAEDAEWLKCIPLFVNHARVAELPLQMGLIVRVAEASGDDAMMRCLQTYFG